jgi:hypothetical protein
MMSNDEGLFWELLELSDAKLIIDNDMCMVAYGEEDEDGDQEYQAFDFGPTELVFMFAEKYNIETETV